MEAPQNLEQVLVREENGPDGATTGATTGATIVATINRPEAMNALNARVMQSLDSLVTWIASRNVPTSDDTNMPIRALVITGAGEKSFVAGADITQFDSIGPGAAIELAKRGQALFSRLERLSIPVIAAVNGFALGGGLELALACDFIYAAEGARFGLPECTLGIMPGYGGTVRLPRRVGPARAKEIALSGGMITAQEAFAMGLVNRVVPANELITKCLETCKTLSSRAPLALGAIKRSINEGMNMETDDAGELEGQLFGELFATADKQEGVRAFMEKRKPSFKGK
jgi:enoyl-CoA hydratase